MKKYEHAKQRKLSLTSIIKNTMLNRDESSQEQSETNGNSVKERVVGCNRKDNGKRENQSGGNSTEDRFPTTQHQQDHASKECREFGFSCKNGGKHRIGGGNENQAIENIDDELDPILCVSNL